MAMPVIRALVLKTMLCLDELVIGGNKVALISS